MKAVEKYLEKADTVLKNSPELVDTSAKKIKDEAYDGYLNGFGPAVITAGLLPTLATYGAETNRKKILDAIAKVAQIGNIITGQLLLEHCLQASKPQQNILKEKIINASVALKLMIRTYNQKS